MSVTRTCGTCGRSWSAPAAFCGTCGALLDDGLATTRTPGPSAARRRHPVVAGGVVALAVVAVVAAVPSLSIDRTPPVDGTIGVPAPDDLQAAPADTTVRRPVEAPEVVCLRDDVAVDCVAWSRALASPPSGRDEFGAWVLPVGDRVLVVTEDRVEAVDAADGTRLWQRDTAGEGGLYPVGVVGHDGLVLAGGNHTAVVDLRDGGERWVVDTGVAAWGMGADADLVLVQAPGRSGVSVVAHDAADGHRRWAWDAPWVDVHVARPPGSDRIVVVSSAGDGLAVLDRATGRELARSEDMADTWLVGVLDDVAVVATSPATPPASAPDLAGDGGATLRGIDLAGGAQRWEHDVPASNRGFDLAGGLVVAPSTGQLTAIDARTGQVVWEVPTQAPEFSASHGTLWSASAAATGEPVHTLVTVEPSQSVLRGRDPTTGAVRWERETRDGIHHASVDGDRLLVFAVQGTSVHDAATGAPVVQVRTSNGSPVGADPFLLYHHGSGYVTRIDVDGASGR